MLVKKRVEDVKMNLRQFLKQENRKTAIFFIMLLFYLSAFSMKNASFCGHPPISEQCSNYYAKYWIDPCPLYCGEPDLLTSVFNVVYYVLWFIGIFIIYLFSCFIMWLYEKYFKKVKKK